VKTLEDLGAVLATEGRTVTFAESACAEGAVGLVVERGEVIEPAPSTEAPDFVALFRRVVAEALIQLRELPMISHPRTPSIVPQDNREEGNTPMTDQDKLTLMAEFDAKLATAVKDATEPLKGEITRLTEAKTATETELTKMRETASTAKAQALTVEAERFTEARSRKENLRIFPSQRKAATALYRRLDDEDVAVSAAEAKAFGLKDEKDYTARDLFIEFVEQHPHAPILQSVGLQTPAGEAATDFDAVLKETAKREGIDLEKHSEKVRALNIVAREHPELVPGAQRSKGQTAA